MLNALQNEKGRRKKIYESKKKETGITKLDFIEIIQLNYF